MLVDMVTCTDCQRSGPCFLKTLYGHLLETRHNDTISKRRTAREVMGQTRGVECSPLHQLGVMRGCVIN